MAAPSRFCGITVRIILDACAADAARRNPGPAFVNILLIRVERRQVTDSWIRQKHGFIATAHTVWA